MSGELIPLSRPFSSIAIASSGGGFRAASFTLGTLSYLNKIIYKQAPNDQANAITLLDRVDFMGSASGGTITTAYFTLRRKQGEPFTKTYTELYALMQGDKLLKKALTILNDDTQWNRPGDFKRRNLINAFAKTYDTEIFQGATWATYWEPNTHKTIEVCFNATEFRRGLWFRFQTDGNQQTKEPIGNSFTWLNQAKLSDYLPIKLGDMLAASSCFPGGFEPIIYPDDFAYQSPAGSLTKKALAEATLLEHYNKTITALPFEQNIGLMDGGIADNQGLKSTMQADERRRSKTSIRPPFDLILITDVASYYMDTYQVPETGELKGVQTKSIQQLWTNLCAIPKKIRTMAFIATAVLLVSTAVAIFQERPEIRITATFVAGLSCAAAVIGWYAYRLPKKWGIKKYLRKDFDPTDILKKSIPTITHFSDDIIRELLSFLKNTRLGILRQMLMARVRSVLLMVADINLKHVRRLIYNELYEDRRWDNRRCANFIYELSKQNKEARKKSLDEDVEKKKLQQSEADLLLPSDKILEVAEKARCVGTTLWYDANNEIELKDTVACGQFSTCVNLLQYIQRLENNTALILDTDAKDLLHRVRRQLEDDWAKFQQDPYWLWQALKQAQAMSK